MTSARAFSCASVGGGEGTFFLFFFFGATVFRLLAILAAPTPPCYSTRERLGRCAVTP